MVPSQVTLRGYRGLGFVQERVPVFLFHDSVSILARVTQSFSQMGQTLLSGSNMRSWSIRMWGSYQYYQVHCHIISLLRCPSPFSPSLYRVLLWYFLFRGEGDYKWVSAPLVATTMLYNTDKSVIETRISLTTVLKFLSNSLTGLLELTILNSEHEESSKQWASCFYLSNMLYS